MKNSGCVIRLLVCLSVGSAQAVFAGEYSDARRKAAQVQSGNINSGQVEDAIARYCRTLNINPHGNSIKENLSAILTSPRATAEQKSEVLRVEDLFDQIKKLQKHNSFLIQKCDRLKKQLIETGHNSTKLNNGLSSIRQRSNSYPSIELRGEKDLDQNIGHLTYVIRSLTDKKQKLASQAQNTQEQYQWLEALKKGGASPSTTLPPNEQAKQPAPGQSIDISKERFRQVPSAVILPAPELTQLKASDSNLGQTSLEKDTRIDRLSDQLVDLSLKMEETQVLLRDKEESMSSLSERLNEIEQRFLLERRIIQDKDEEIKKLRDAIKDQPAQPAQYTKGEEEISRGTRNTFTQNHGSGRSYEEALASSKAMLSEKENLLGALEEELADVQEKYKLNQKVLEEKKQQIARLRQELSTARAEFRVKSIAMEPVLDKKEKEIKELNGVINIYKYALEGSIRAIREKSEDLDYLNDELAKVQAMFQDNGKLYDQRDVQICVLKDALKHERLQEDQRNINLRKMVQSKNEEINELRAQLTAAERNLEVASGALQEKVAYLEYTKRQLEAYRAPTGAGPEAFGSLGDYRREWMDPDAPPVDQQTAELSGMLNIYKEKLSDEHKSTKEKTALISTLEDRLGDMQFQIDAKDKVLAQTQSDLRSLKERLDAVEVELMNLKEAPPQNGLHNISVDHKISELQTQFTDIQNFLLENLYGSDKMNANIVTPRVDP